MKHIVLTPYNTFDISTFVIHGDYVHIGHFVDEHCYIKIDRVAGIR